MKRTLTTLLIAGFSFAALAGDLQWYTDMDKAKAVAKAEGKTLLLNFTGSDWCGWCKKLDREVFSQSDFEKFANENLVLVELDFPKYKSQSKATRKANEKLLQKYGVRGFPTILLVSSQDDLLLRTGYKAGGAEKYVSFLAENIPN